MTIYVRYFASLRENMGRGEDHVAAEGIVTIADLWHRASGDMALPKQVLCAVNMEYADFSALVRDGDEVAFFPPVTGG
jgi:molybdopterin synthase sulfur carrier subunit